MPSVCWFQKRREPVDIVILAAVFCIQHILDVVDPRSQSHAPRVIRIQHDVIAEYREHVGHHQRHELIRNIDEMG
jgi:hypothetical protein